MLAILEGNENETYNFENEPCLVIIVVSDTIPERHKLGMERSTVLLTYSPDDNGVNHLSRPEIDISEYIARPFITSHSLFPM